MAAFSASFLLVLSSAVSASAADVTIYDSMPSALASTYPSEGFQATQSAEFGDQITLGGTNRDLSSVEVVLVDWACQNGHWTGTPALCTTTPGATFTHDMTLNIYNVNTVDPTKPGTLIGYRTQTVTVPFRPSSDVTNCPGPNQSQQWWDGTKCNYGLAFTTTWDFSSLNLVLPDSVIVTITYNTTTYGPNPIGGTDSPYDSLNIGVTNVPPTVGTEDPHRIFWNTLNTTYGGDGTLKEIVDSPELASQPPYGSMFMRINAKAALASTGIDSQALVTGAGIAGTLFVIGLALAVLTASRRRRAAISERG
ncbi:MAG: hypothetical protein KF742_02150 [Cryobacterium sp.]|nr:hypothetical protein [Cryobacterium sp.]